MRVSVHHTCKIGLICMTLAVAAPVTSWGSSLEKKSPANSKLGLTASQLVTLVTSNQLVLERAGNTQTSLASCYCGPSLAWEQVPKHLWQALVAIEDRRFFMHRGLDPLGIARAIKRNLFAGHFIEGGSTITQQLCKIKVLQSSKSFARKIDEARCALQLEGVISKQQILLAYLNGTYFGQTSDGKPIIGVEQASRFYFRKSATNLNLLEAAYLAGMQKAPNAYRPDRHPHESLNRAEAVLEAMVHEGFISKKAATASLKTGIRPGRLAPVRFDFRYFRDWVLSDLSKAGLSLKPGIRVPLTLEVTTQGNAERAFQKRLNELSEGSPREAAFITMKLDGRVVALSGGRHYGRRQFNNATQARRQPASAFKPFVFLAAVERGLKPSSRLDDFPYAGEKWTDSIVSHHNGKVSMREALAKSANIATIRLCRRIGAKKVAMAANRLGIKSQIPSDSCRIAIGESEVIPLELTGAYAALANGGTRVEPFGFWGATSLTGEALYWRTDTRKRVIHASTRG